MERVALWSSVVVGLCGAYAPPLRYFASCARGLESVLASELSSEVIGASRVTVGSAGCEFDGDVGVLYRAGLEARTATKVSELLACECGVGTAEDLYDVARSVRWEDLMDVAGTLKVDATLGRSVSTALTHSHFTSLTVKNAVVDSFRSSNRLGSRPSVDTGSCCDLPVSVYLDFDEVRVYRSLTAESLHRRGYRGAVSHKAALRSTVAAGLLHLADWPARSRYDVLCDPMCGSGTVAVEAALMARRIAPGLKRAGRWPGDVPGDGGGDDEAPPRFACEAWLDFDRGAWDSAVDAALGRVLPRAPCPILASDAHGGAVALAKEGAARAGVGADVDVRFGDASTIALRTAPNVVVSNPPWDGRLDGAEAAWVAMSDFLRREAPGASAHLLTGNMDVTRNLRMRSSSKRKLVSGNVDLRFLRYHVRGPEGAAPPPPRPAPPTAETRAPPPSPRKSAKPPPKAPRARAATPAAAVGTAVDLPPSPWGDLPPSPWGPPPPAAVPPDYASLTVVELKDILRGRGLRVSGRKADLVDRLVDADAARLAKGAA